jgi:hypothetical protein
MNCVRTLLIAAIVAIPTAALATFLLLGAGGIAASPTNPTFTALQTFFIAPPTASPAGNDSNPGTLAEPWATPKHSVNCGAVIIVEAGSYTTQFGAGNWGAVSNCPSTSGGIDGTGGIFAAAVVCAGPSMESCPINGGNNEAVRIDASNWAIEGFTGTSAPVTGTACYSGSSSVTSTTSLHHILFVNDMAVECAHDGFDTFPFFQDTGSGSVDQTAVIGVVAFGAGQNNAFCNSGVSMIPTDGPDTSAGTHVFNAGIFSYHNIDNPCSGFPDSAVTATTGTPGTFHSGSLYTANEIVDFSSTGTLPGGLIANTQYFVCSANLVQSVSFQVSTSLNCPTALAITSAGTGTLTATTQKTTDGEGVIFDSWGLQLYTFQGVIEQSAMWGNGSAGIEVFINNGPDESNNFFFNNSTFGNVNDPLHNSNNSAEIDLQAVKVGANSIKSVTNNLTQSKNAIPAGSNSVQCSTANYGCPVYGFAIAGVPATPADAIITGNFFADLAASCAGTCDSINATIAFDGNTVASNTLNTLSNTSVPTGTTPGFANPTALPTTAPNCSAFMDVTDCMNIGMGVAADLAPSGAAVGKGYQPPGPCTADPFFPTWAKGLVYLHWNGAGLTENAGLITKPCGV